MSTHDSTLLDFALNVVVDQDARDAFQLDPQGALEAAGLGDITPADLHEILPLVLDTASVVNVDAFDKVLAEASDLNAAGQLNAIAGNIDGVTTIADVAAPSAITALVTDFGNAGDVSNTLDATLVKGNDVFANVSDLAYDNAVVTKVSDVADVNVKDTADVLVKDLDTDVLVKDVVDSNAIVKDVLVKDVSDINVDVHHVVDVTDNVVQNVAQVGDVHNTLDQVVGNVKVGDIDLLDQIGSGNVLDLHL